VHNARSKSKGNSNTALCPGCLTIDTICQALRYSYFIRKSVHMSLLPWQ